MRQTKEPSEVHLNWDAILTLISVLLLSTGIWGAAIRALMVFIR